MLPLWLKLAQTAVTAVVAPVNWRAYGARNFLWFSDVALLMLVAAVWAESAALVSAAAVGVAALELLWDADWLCGLARGGRAPLGLAGYMFDARIPRSVRAVSLFHLWLQAALLLSLRRLGYDDRGLGIQIAVCWLVLPAAAALATPEENINWALGPGGRPPAGLSERGYLALEMAALPLLIYLPSHFVLRALFG